MHPSMENETENLLDIEKEKVEVGHSCSKAFNQEGLGFF